MAAASAGASSAGDPVRAQQQQQQHHSHAPMSPTSMARQLQSQSELPYRGAGDRRSGANDLSGYPQQFDDLRSNPSGRGLADEAMSSDGLTSPSNMLTPGLDRPGRTQDQLSSDGTESRDRSRQPRSRRPSGNRICGKCGGNLTGQFVRALENTYHLECFTCHDCGKIVASKFFPVPDQPPNQYPLCETDYFRRLDLLCSKCGGALRGSYITALNRKFHIEHFTCSVCPTIFGAQDSYYEHQDAVYCHYHYSTKFAERCNGCQTAILKQFVEIFRNGQDQRWHPECYMIHKYWNVRLRGPDEAMDERPSTPSFDDNATEESRQQVRRQEEMVEERVLWIWRTLSTFEERSATTISDMLLHVSGGAYFDGVMAARKFITHVELLFSAAEDLDRILTQQTPKGLVYTREAKLLCKKIVAFFALLSQSRGTGVRKLGVTQELLSLVTGLAHYLKLIIRICLQGSLRLEREAGNAEGLAHFLDQVNSLDDKLDRDAKLDATFDPNVYVPSSADTCPICNEIVEDRCIRKDDRVFHTNCMICQNCGTDFNRTPQDAKWSPTKQKLLCRDCGLNFPDAETGFAQVSRMEQYVYLLKVAHGRLLNTLRSSGALPHTSDNPNLAGDYDSRQGHRLGPVGETEALLTNPRATNTRSKSYAGTTPVSGPQHQSQSSYEQTLGDIRRLKSTRLDRHLSSAVKRPRASRIIDGPEGASIGAEGEQQRDESGINRTMSIVQDRANANGDNTQSILGLNNSLALDDIPRMLAAEQAREQRPNASKYARGNLVGAEPKPRVLNGHRRETSAGDDLEKAVAAGLAGEGRERKEYFSQLSPLEYFGVRHIAVVLLGQSLDGQYNQEELLELIETRKRTFWGDVAKAFGGGKAKPGEKEKSSEKKVGKGKNKGVFGRSLESSVEKDWHEAEGVGLDVQLKVPALIHDAIAAMKLMDMSVEGVFRKNGNIKRLKDLAEEIDAKGCSAVNLNKESPVQVASLLKKYLRDLPDPVLTFKLHPLFITAAKLTEDDKRKRVFHLLCCLLPKTHRDTMEVLFEFLTWCSSFHTVDEESGSKMDIHNLATVIAPNMLYSITKQPDMDSSFLAIEAVHTLIEANQEFSMIPEDISSILSDPSLFANSSQEVTTKEILKRYNEIKNQNPNRPPGSGGTLNSPSLMSPTARSQPGSGRPSAPQVTRVDTSPNIWQTESHVRHVGGGNSANHSSTNVNYTGGTTPTGNLATSPYQHPNSNSSFPTSNHNNYPNDLADLQNPQIPFADPRRGSTESQRRANAAGGVGSASGSASGGSPHQPGFRGSAYQRGNALGVT